MILSPFDLFGRLNGTGSKKDVGEFFPDFDQDTFDDTAAALEADGYEMIFAKEGQVYVFRKYNVVH